MSWTPYLIGWICLGFATLALALYRKFLTMKEDDLIHPESWKSGDVARQTLAARRFHTIDRLGEMLTIVTIVAGLAIAIAYVYGRLYS